MTRNLKHVMAVILVLLLGASSAQAGWLDRLFGKTSEEPTEESADKSVSTADVSDGLKEALEVGVGNVVNQLGRDGGFSDDPVIHIPLPETLDTVRSTLERFGMSDTLDDLELRMNRSAELATPIAKDLFVGAIKEMTLDDVMGIYNGSDDAATQYFKSKMSNPLGKAMHPIVDDTLSEAGAVQVYDNVMDQYDSIPFAPEVDSDLTGYVVEKGLDGIFYYLAQEEAAIRKDPVKRTTDLLQRVFGSKE